MENTPANNEKEKKKKKSKKKKKTKDGGVTPGGPMVEATDSTNTTAATQGVRVGTERREVNGRNYNNINSRSIVSIIINKYVYIYYISNQY